MTRFEKWIAVIGSLTAVGVLCVGIANYRHTVEHDEKQQNNGITSAAPPAILTNIAKPVEKAPDKQPEKEPEKSVERVEQQKPPDLHPVDTPMEPPKEEAKPFTFWGYLPAGQGRTAQPGIMFQVDSCPIGRTLVTCTITATSPHYDRQLYFDMFNTTITDSEGDVFRVQPRSFAPLQLDRDAPLPFKLEFPVNKDLAMPIVVRLNGTVPNLGSLQNASFRITSK